MFFIAHSNNFYGLCHTWEFSPLNYSTELKYVFNKTDIDQSYDLEGDEIQG